MSTKTVVCPHCKKEVNKVKHKEGAQGYKCLECDGNYVLDPYGRPKKSMSDKNNSIIGFIAIIAIVGVCIYAFLPSSSEEESADSLNNQDEKTKVQEKTPDQISAECLESYITIVNSSQVNLEVESYLNHMSEFYWVAGNVMQEAWTVADCYPNITSLKFNYGIEYSNKFGEVKKILVGIFEPDLNKLRKYKSMRRYSEDIHDRELSDEKMHMAKQILDKCSEAGDCPY